MLGWSIPGIAPAEHGSALQSGGFLILVIEKAGPVRGTWRYPRSRKLRTMLSPTQRDLIKAT
ncbi:MAG TPA: hypothetical protein VF513_06690, partial [Stenotrophomonas sp.]